MFNFGFFKWCCYFFIYLFLNLVSLCFFDINILFVIYLCVYYIVLICFFFDQIIMDIIENYYEGIIDGGWEFVFMFDILKDQISKMNQVIGGFFIVCLVLYNV